MATPKIAVQMIVFAEEVKKNGYEKTLCWLSEQGIRAVELSKVPVNRNTMPEIEALCRSYNMEVCCMNVNLEAKTARGEPSLETDFDELVSYARRLNCRYFRIGMMPSWAFGKEDALSRLAGILDNYGSRLLSEGIHFYYHHHEIEFQKFNGKYGLEILLENTDQANLGIELDTHWLQFGGQNPVYWIKKLKGRADLVHLKDYRIVMPSEGVSGEVTNPKENRKKIVQFAEIGTGNLDMKAIIDACIETGVKYMPIEQDTTYGLSPYDSIALSLRGLRELGYADLF